MGGHLLSLLLAAHEDERGDVPGWVMIVLMTASQFITQLQIMAKNQSPEMKASPMYKQQRILLYIIPVFLLVSATIGALISIGLPPSALTRCFIAS